MSFPDSKETRLLIAEDDPFVRRMLVTAAREQGFIISGEAACGLDAVTQAFALRPDAILMDIEMPGLNGLEATRRIQQSQPTPIVVVTAHETPEILKDVAASGAGAYVVKPPDPAELARGITIAMARHADLMQLKNRVTQNELLVREVYHRVANQMSASSALLHLQSSQVRHSSARTVLLETENRLRAMARIHSSLQHASSLTHIPLGLYLSRLSRDLIAGLRPDLKYREVLQEDSLTVPSATATHCGLLTHELVMNCIRHAYPGRLRGIIQLSLSSLDGGQIHLSVKDDGVGLPRDFQLDRLSSLGLMIVSTMTRTLTGTLSLTSCNPGTECAIAFPRTTQETP